MSLRDIRAAVVGVGFIGVAHVEALRRIGVVVAGVVGSTPERARVKAETAGLPTVYDSVEALAADDSIDVIHIASPNYAHADQVRTLAGNRLMGRGEGGQGGHRKLPDDLLNRRVAFGAQPRL